jgi:hypothetical protein
MERLSKIEGLKIQEKENLMEIKVKILLKSAVSFP